MSDFPSAIAAVRDAVCGILRIRPVRPGAHEFQVAFVGTGWCFSPRRYLATAHHVFDDGKARNPSDKFYAIVVAQYDFGPHYSYELNVGWHHGESGGPIFSLEPLAAFAMMQSYRNIQSPHGVVAGPHMGRAMSVMTTALTAHGATIV